MYYFIALMTITLILLWLCQIVFFDRIYKTVMINELETQASVLLSSGSTDELSANAAELCENSGLCITLYSGKTKTAYKLSDIEYSDCYLYRLKINQLITIYEKAQENGGELLQTFTFDKKTMAYTGVPFSVNSPDESHSVLYVRLFKTASGEKCALFINKVISPVGATKSTNLLILSVLSALYLVITVITVIAISRNIARPLVGINRSAKGLKKGSYNEKYLQKVGYREVDELAHTLESASAELSKVETLQRELIANVSHDLRTPLTLISGYSEIMRDIPGEANKENCQIIIDEVARLSSLVNDLLEISKLQSGTLEPNMSEFSITSLLSECIDGYGELASVQGYDLTFDYSEDVIVSADRTMIFQAARNLINNALTYTGADKTVKVTQELCDGFVRISITDTGEGIAPERLRDIWDRYYRDSEHKRAQNGTGLGLSIVKSVVKMHNGRYGVKSRLGAGSTFWFEIPIAK